MTLWQELQELRERVDSERTQLAPADAEAPIRLEIAFLRHLLTELPKT